MKEYKLFDLFAGISDTHTEMHYLENKCIFVFKYNVKGRKNLLNKFKRIESNLFKYHSLFTGDISKYDPKDILFYDIFCAGYDC